MKIKNTPYFWHLITLSVITAFFLVLIFLGNRLLTDLSKSPTEIAIQHKLALENQGFKNIHFELSDPEEAPSSLAELVMLGYHIMNDTKKYVSVYAGDRLNCSNCHFAGGNSTGGENAGLSLAGVAAVYPAYVERFGRVISLEERINNCFEKSMNGTPLPLDSKEMLALTTYFHWISKNYPIYAKVPWIGLQPLKKEYTPVPEQGKMIWNAKCAICHGSDGQGRRETTFIPPVWGMHAFNDEAGMNQQGTLEAFIYWNMPYTNASLTIEEAQDVAAFIISQPHPHFGQK